MRFIFTAMRHAFSVFDTDTGRLDHIESPVSDPDGQDRPFGITWDAETLYVAYPRSILAFDRRFRFKGEVLTGLASGIHQILLHDGRLWMVSPRLNCVKIHSFKDGSMRYFLPEEGVVQKTRPKRKPIQGRTKYIYDLHHYNSILIKDDKLYLSAHNFDKPSYVSVFSYPELKLDRKIVMGQKIHGVAVDDDLYVCDSGGSRCVVSEAGQSIPMGAHYRRSFLRGLAVTKDYVCAAHFPFQSDRADRRTGDSHLSIVHRATGRRTQFLLPEVGNVNDLRVLDEPDFAHGVEPFRAEWD